MSAVLTVLVFGSIVAFSTLAPMGPAMGYSFALMYVLAFTLISRLAVDTSWAVRSRVVIRDSAVLGITSAVILGAWVGIGAGFEYGALSGSLCALATALVFGSMFGSTARQYGVFLLFSLRRLPLRLGRFLDWACTAGLLRHSGPAYQFRHAELQAWIAAHPDPVR